MSQNINKTMVVRWNIIVIAYNQGIARVEQTKNIQKKQEPVHVRPFAPKKTNKKDFDRLVNSAGFVLVMGLLIMASGLACYMAFLNRFSFYLLDVGCCFCLYAFAIKVIDVFLKIIGVRD